MWVQDCQLRLHLISKRRNILGSFKNIPIVPKAVDDAGRATIPLNSASRMNVKYMSFMVAAIELQ